VTIEPAALSFDAHGAPVSERYGDVYASREGALGQARHVFLGGARCVDRWRGRSQFVILENGFGLGVNFLASWQAWRDDPARPQRLHFVSIERHPLPASALTDTAPAELKELAAQLAAQWPLPISGLHRCEFEQGRVVLTLALGDARELASGLRLGADAIFLDGFAPDRNPEMWEPALLRSLARLVRPDGRVATWSTARAVREALAAAGFELELVPGFGRKRQMLAGRYAPRYTVRRHEPPSAYAGERSAIVIGGGLAGAACADALARRDWSVRVVDSAPPASGASALPWGLMHPHFAADDNLLARLTRAGGAATARALDRVAPGGQHTGDVVWRRDGFFQQVADAEEARWRAALAAKRLPARFVEWMNPDDAFVRLGVRPARPGLWWPEGRLISPPRWIAALLDSPRVALAQSTVDRIDRNDDRWIVRGTRGDVIGDAVMVVVATAMDVPRLLGSAALPVQAVPGQVTFIDAPQLASLRAGMGGDGTLLHAPDGRLAVGATYETLIGPVDAALDERMASRSNLARLERLLAEPAEARVAGRYTGVRCVARDRLPYAGAVADELVAAAMAAQLRGARFDDLPRRPRLFASLAHGSRGLTFAALAAELIAAHAEGEPLPVERALADAIDPGRVLLRRLRRGAVRLPEPATAR
jgi:tRNA 5-methylaminomethyl-2-thiouridine biosynthesis bifunctional protein